MTEIRVDTIVDAAGTGAPDFSTAPTVGGVALGSLSTSSFTSSGTEPSSPSDGAVWWDTANSELKIYANSAWQTVTLGALPPQSYYGDRAVVFGARYNGNYYGQRIQYFDITTTGNASSFGLDLYSRGANGEMACAGGSRALMWQGVDFGVFRDTISYIETTTTGNATQFGSTPNSRYEGAACADGTYGMACDGYNSSHSNQSNIDYVTIATTGNASAFGNDHRSRTRCTATSDGTYGYIIFDGSGSTSQALSKFTFGTSGSATNPGYSGGSFSANYWGTMSGDESYAIHAGGRAGTTDTQSMYRWTWGTSANCSYMGNVLPTGRRNHSSTTNGSRWCIIGGRNTDEILYIDLYSGSSTTDFGDLMESGHNFYVSATSGPAS